MGSAFVTVKNTEINNGLEALRGLDATYDSNNKGRQRVRIQCLLQPKRAESILQTTAAVERWDCDVGQYDKRFGKTLDEDVKIGVILALAPLQVLWTGGSSSCQCTTTFYGEKTTRQKNAFRILLKFRSLLADFLAVVGHS